MHLAFTPSTPKPMDHTWGLCGLAPAGGSRAHFVVSVLSRALPHSDRS